jgi:hypothetical protein
MPEGRREEVPDARANLEKHIAHRIVFSRSLPKMQASNRKALRLTASRCCAQPQLTVL